MATKAGMDGGKKLARKFREIGKNAETAVEKAIQKGALIVERSAKQKAPVDTGRLRSSITHRIKEEDGNPVAEVGTGVSYSRHVEYGSSKAPAQPFLMPAYMENRSLIKNEIKKALQKVIQKATKG